MQYAALTQENQKLKNARVHQGSAIMMNADSLQLCLHTIQKKTSPRIKAYIANPRYGFVHHIEAFVNGFSGDG